MSVYQMLEVQIGGEWLHCFDLGCDRDENEAEAALIEAIFRKRGLTYPIRLREVPTLDQMLAEGDWRAQDHEDVRLAICEHCEGDDCDDFWDDEE